MKRGYTLIELVLVLAIITILMLPTLNISKSYREAIRRVKGKSIINEMFRKRCRQKKLLTLLFFMRTVCQSVKQREKAHTFGERYTPSVRKM